MEDGVREIIELSYRNKISHLSSTLSAYPIIKRIYERRNPDDPFILSQGHAALALYVVLGRGQELLDKMGTQPHRSIEDGIYCTTGSLGMGLTVALGMAMAGKRVDCLISDGECAEGCVWEVMRQAKKFPNLSIYVNYNGMTAMGMTDSDLEHQLRTFVPYIKICKSPPLNLGFTRGLEAHYHVITDEEYSQL